MREIISNLLLPMPVFWFLTGFALITDFSVKKARTKVMLTVAFLILMISSTAFVPNLAANIMENKYAGNDIENMLETGKPVHILVLGGGHTFDKRLPANSQLSENALGRLSEGIRIHRMLPGSKLITSGAGLEGQLTQAEILRNAAILLGVDSASVRMQTQPFNTWTEAGEYKKNFGNSAQLILVTSALHMPRSVYLFKKAGLNPMAAPTNFRVKKSDNINRWFWVPSSGNIAKTEAVVHELLGLLWARLAY